MYLFILESIGTSELLLIGLIALVFLGPRRLPELARKFGKVMNEFRRTTSEFKQTWEREVTSEVDQIKDEANVFSFPDDADATENTVSKKPVTNDRKAVVPEIKEVSKEDFDESISKENQPKEEKVEEEDDLTAKQNWL